MDSGLGRVVLTRTEVQVLLETCYNLFDQIMQIIETLNSRRTARYVRPVNPNQNMNNTNKYWRGKSGRKDKGK